MKPRHGLSVLLLLLLACTGVATAATCTVSGGNIQAAINSCTSPGDIIAIPAGTYTQSVTLAASGSAGNPIRIQPVGYTNDGCGTPGCGSGAAVTWTSPNGPSSDYYNGAISGSDRSYVRIQGLTFSGSTSQTVISIENFAGDTKTPFQEGIDILNNTFSNNGNDGLAFGATMTIKFMRMGRPSTYTGPPTSFIQGNTFTNNFGFNIRLDLSSNFLISNNDISVLKGSADPSNSVPVGSGIFSGSYVNCKTTCAINNIIEDNLIHDANFITGGSFMIGIYFDAWGRNSTIQRNRIRDLNYSASNSFGIHLEAAGSDSLIQENIIYRIGQSCIVLGTWDAGGSNPIANNDIIKNNVGYDCRASGLSLDHASNSFIQNNIFFNNGQGNRNIQVSSHNLNVNNSFSNNIWYRGGGITTVGLWNTTDLFSGTINATTLTQWGTLSGEAVSSSCATGQSTTLQCDPLFVNAAAGDFHLQAASPAKGAGIGGVDMGAYPSPAAATTLIVKLLMTENSGSHTVLDTSGNSLNGQRCEGATCPAAGPTWQPGRLLFDGVNDQVQVSNHALLNFTGDLTVGGFLNRDRTGIAEGLMAKTNGTRQDWAIWFEPSNVLCFWRDGAAPESACSTATLTDTANNHHVAVTRSGATVTFYLDGVPIGTGSVAAAMNANPDPVVFASDGNVFFQGPMWDARVYQGALTLTEIQAWAALRVRPCP